jgi:hypothetical protein
LNIFAALKLHYFSTFPTSFVVKHDKYVPDPGRRIHVFKIGGLVGILGTALGHSHRTYFATCTGPGGARCLSPSTCLNMTYGILLSCVVLSFGHLKGWPLLPSGAIKRSLLKHHSKLETSSSGTSQIPSHVWLPNCIKQFFVTKIQSYSYILLPLPVVPHKAVAEVSKIGNL